MNIKIIKQLIKIFEKSKISELEVEEEGIKVRLSRSLSSVDNPEIAYQVPIPSTISPQHTSQDIITQQQEKVQPIPTTPKVEKKKEYYEIKSPMVGTFYHAPAPDAEPYVEVGSKVQAGETLCIIEAMKLMNEIESETSGVIKEILIENAQPVEYNQVLFLIDTST